MDILSRLPVEISQKIFLSLSGRDLRKCLCVSKSWRNVCNTDYLWKNICQREHINTDLSAVSEEIEESELNSWAKAYIKYDRELKWIWEHNKSRRDILLEQVKDSRADVHTDGRTLVYSLSNVIHVFSLTPRVKKLGDISIPEIGGTFVWSVTDTETIVSTRGSNIWVHKSGGEGRYRLEAAWELRDGGLVEAGKGGEGGSLCCLSLVNGVAWIYEDGKNTLYLYSVGKRRIVRKLCHESYLTVNTQCEDKMYLAMEESILCYSHEGELELRVPLPGVQYLSVGDPGAASRLLSQGGLPRGRGSIALGASLLVFVSLPPGRIELTLCPLTSPPHTTVYSRHNEDYRACIVKIIRDRFLFCYPSLVERCYSVFELPSCRLLYSKMVPSTPRFVDDESVVFAIMKFRDFNLTVHSYRPSSDPDPL